MPSQGPGSVLPKSSIVEASDDVVAAPAQALRRRLAAGLPAPPDAGMPAHHIKPSFRSKTVVHMHMVFMIWYKISRRNKGGR